MNSFVVSREYKSFGSDFKNYFWIFVLVVVLVVAGSMLTAFLRNLLSPLLTGFINTFLFVGAIIVFRWCNFGKKEQVVVDNNRILVGGLEIPKTEIGLIEIKLAKALYPFAHAAPGYSPSRFTHFQLIIGKKQGDEMRYFIRKKDLVTLLDTLLASGFVVKENLNSDIKSYDNMKLVDIVLAFVFCSFLFLYF